jgi:hypothetical protein
VLAAGFLALGLVFGFVSLALGPLGLIETLIVLGLVLVQIRRYPERTGAYLVGMSILPVIILSSIVARFPGCPVHGNPAPQCYEPITIPALILYVLAGLAGAVLLGLTLRRLWRASNIQA